MRHPTNEHDIRAAISTLADDFALQRDERLQRTALVREDFDRLAEAGLLRTGLPAARGGLWRGVAESTRLYCDLARTIARGDPSLGLVTCMHPSVLVFWLAREAVAPPHDTHWARQRDEVFGHVEAGHWFGTVASEPGAGGDSMATRAVARPDGTPDAHRYRITGDKFMGSGSGIASFMVTTARPEGEADPDLFLLDMRPAPNPGIDVTREWSGYGMSATQSHAYRLEDAPAERTAWPAHIAELAPPAVTLAGCLFTSVAVGILDAAVAEARRRLAPRAESLGALERVEWTRAVNEHWTATQLLTGALTAVESGPDHAVAVNRAKLVIAELAESATRRLALVLGGSSLARPSPFGQWLQDVRALGYLRPPWPLAFERLYEASWQE